VIATLALAGLTAVFAPSDLGPTDTADVGVVERTEEDPTVFPDPARFSRGFFVEAGSGPIFPVGSSASVLSPGLSVSGRTGYEFRRWLAVQAQVSASMSHYDDGVLTDELLQQYSYLGHARLGIPIRRFVILLYGGAGLLQFNSNLLQVAGINDDAGRLGLAYEGGLGLDVHTLAKHFSGGLLASFLGSPRLGGGSVGVSLYLRFTL
jgi:hypothetical protein